MIKIINNEFNKYTIFRGNSYYLFHEKFKDYIKYLIDNGYVILGYDGLIIDKKGIMSPISLVFDFSIDNYSDREKNELALDGIFDFYGRVNKYGYDLNNLYVDVIFRKFKIF